MSQDFTHRLRELMRSVGFSSFKALSQSAGVSERQLLRLRRGEIANLRVDALLKLSQTLQVSVGELLVVSGQESGVRSQESEGAKETGRQGDTGTKLKISPTLREAKATETLRVSRMPKAIQNSKLKTQNSTFVPELSALQQEYDRLQQQLVQQRQMLWQEFQQASIQTLESLLLQLPTAAYAAQQNPQAPAVKLLPLLRPLDRLLADWGIESIAPVGAEISYDPRYHQLMAGTAQTGEQVKVRYAGYRQGDRLLYRAKVSPLIA